MTRTQVRTVPAHFISRLHARHRRVIPSRQMVTSASTKTSAEESFLPQIKQALSLYSCQLYRKYQGQPPDSTDRKLRMEPPSTPVKIQQLSHCGPPRISPGLLQLTGNEISTEPERMNPVEGLINICSPACAASKRRCGSASGASSKRRKVARYSIGTLRGSYTGDTILKLLGRLSSRIVTASSPHSKFSIVQSMLHVLQAAYGRTAGAKERGLLADSNRSDFPC